MKAICVDGEASVVRMAVSACQAFAELENPLSFTKGADAAAWAEEHDLDLAVLGTNLPDLRGLTLAERIRETNPDAEIIILSEDGRYAVDAFSIRACGYLLKPVSLARLNQELEYAFAVRLSHPARKSSAVVAQTFGSFELFSNHEKVQFERSKSKELLALLVDQRGDRLRRSEIYAEMWDGADYDRKAQKMLDVIIRSLKKTLTEYQIDHIIEARDGALRVVPEALECDMYLLMQGDRNALSSFHGVYMSNYPWARMTEGYMTQLASFAREGEKRGHGDADFRR